jgi:hypothetical protein
MPETHLSRAELTGWRDHGAGDRDRLVAHLAACATCRHLAAELERERPLEPGAQPERFRAQDFVAAGRRAGRASPRSVSTPRHLAYLAAAAGLVLAAVIVPLRLRQSSPSALRGDGAAVVTPRHPADETVAADTLAFEWTAAPNAGTLRLSAVALDDPGTPLIDRDVTGTRYTPTADERSRFRAGREYHWFLEYRGGGAGAGTSAAARFRLR